MDVSFEFPNCQADGAEADFLASLNEAGEQGLIANGIHQPRNALAVIVNSPQSGACEKRSSF